MTDQTADQTSAALFERASAVIPGGVNSPVRAFRSVGGTPRFIASARGPYLIDEDGNELVDLVCSWGPMLLGHAHPEVLAAVTAAAARGTSYGAPTRAEVELAELIVDRTPIEQVRLVNSGTEATMSVLRLARGITGRPLIVKFAGCYHGHVDALLVQAGSGLLTLADDRSTVPSSPGVTEAVAADTLVVPYNDRQAVADVFAAHGDRIAALITEAVPGNTGLIEPSLTDADGSGEHFNAFLARICRDHGALFISDEVMTGFRVSRAGQFGRDQVVPDLVTFGKVMGGGFPAAAFGGRAELMAHLSPLGGVYQAGTLSGNPVASAAGATTLRLATDEVYRGLQAASTTVQTAVASALTAAGVQHTITTAGSMFSVFLFDGDPAHPRPVRNAADAAQVSTVGWAALFHSMLDQGVYLPPSAFECWFLSSAHDQAALERIVQALPAAASAAAQAIEASTKGRS